MKKYIICLWMCLGMLVFSACGNDDPIVMEGNYGSKLEIGKDYKISTFTLPHKGNLLDEGVKQLILVLRSLDKQDAEEIELESEIVVGKDILLFSVKIPRKQELADGNYKLWLQLLDKTRLARFFHVRFEKEMLYMVSSQGYEYSFSKTVDNKEDGSETNPYTINNQADFNTLLLALMSDSTSARGLHFKQTSDIVAPNVSTVVDGMQYYGEAFAGTYDGGGMAVTYVYSGQNDSEKGSKVGLFTLLKDGASVKNLVLNATVTGGYSKVGGLAGEASGNIVLENVKVTGRVEASNDYVGGLIGYFNTGSLTVNNCVLDVAVEAGVRFAGGLAGGVDDATLKITGLKTNNVDNAANPTAFSVTGGSYVGGVVGTMGNTSFELKDVDLKHTVDGETSEVKVITSEGAGVGGLFGQSIRQFADCSMENVKVQCPVRLTESGKYCGGLIGYLKLNKNLTVKQCESTSIVYGDEAVGGMIGEVNMESGGNISLAGSFFKNNVCVSDGAVSSIKGRETVGGLVGAFKSGSFTMKNISVATNVICTENNAGGLIGYLENAEIKVEASVSLDRNMLVEGYESIGGLFGCANSSTLEGTYENDVVYNNQIPKMSSFKDQYRGKVRGRNSVGGVLGTLKGNKPKLKYFSIDCMVSSLNDSPAERIGGIVGYVCGNDNNITECVFKGRLNSGGGQFVGGIIGYVYYNGSGVGTIQDCVNYGEVSGGQATGGIIGRMDMKSNASVNYCVNAYRGTHGGIKGSGNVGGIIGWVDVESYLFLKGCANYATVTGTGSGGVGGIVGRLYGSLSDVTYSVNHGQVAGTGEHMAGIVAKFGKDESGLGLQNAYNGEVSSCCNKGDITGTADHIGGIVGYLEEGYTDASNDPTDSGAVFDCYNSGSVSHSDAGGIVGFAEAKSNIFRNLNSGKIAGGKGAGIIADGDFGWLQNSPQCYGNYFIDGSAKDGGETGSKMSLGDADDKSKFHSKWDFSKVWQINAGELPTLRNCSFQNVTFTPES